jgi:hypothetical protein
MKDKKGMSKLKDIYKGVDEFEQVAKVKEILKWVESLPISMGFDALLP